MDPKSPALLPKVTVLIAARNEANNIEGCLSAIVNQSYPKDKLEIIVIDDHSEDETWQLITDAKWSSHGIAISSLQLKEKQGKKAAIATGVKQAAGEIIVTTDADCRMGEEWLVSLISYFDEKTGLVSGPVQMTDCNSWFERMQALEFMGLITVGGASIQAGLPNMCNGANLAYRKEAWEAAGGFDGIDHIASGDDELLMHRIHAAGKWEVKFAKSQAAIVYTPPARSLNEFKQQRIRWVSKSAQYEQKRITLTLTLSYLAMILFPVLLIHGFWSFESWIWLLACFPLKGLAEYAVLWSAGGFFQNRSLLKYLLPEQVLHVIYILWVGVAGNVQKYSWKGRSESLSTK